MKEFNSPLRFWDYCTERRVLINNLTSKNLCQLNGTNANLKIRGDAGDVSNLFSLGWFEWCYFQDGSPFLYQEQKLGRCLGPRASYTMKITTSHTVQPLTEDERCDLNLIRERERELHEKVSIISWK